MLYCLIKLKKGQNVKSDMKQDGDHYNLKANGWREPFATYILQVTNRKRVTGIVALSSMNVTTLVTFFCYCFASRATNAAHANLVS
jgi:hypothetical protein